VPHPPIANRRPNSYMHYLMPKRGILSLHSGCNVGHEGDVTLFFGLSGGWCCALWCGVGVGVVCMLLMRGSADGLLCIRDRLVTE